MYNEEAVNGEDEVSPPIGGGYERFFMDVANPASLTEGDAKAVVAIELPHIDCHVTTELLQRLSIWIDIWHSVYHAKMAPVLERKLISDSPDPDPRFPTLDVNMIISDIERRIQVEFAALHAVWSQEGGSLVEVTGENGKATRIEYPDRQHETFEMTSPRVTDTSSPAAPETRILAPKGEESS